MSSTTRVLVLLTSILFCQVDGSYAQSPPDSSGQAAQRQPGWFVAASLSGYRFRSGTIDGRGAAVAGAAGVDLHRWLGVTVEITRPIPARYTKIRRAAFVSLAPPGATPEEVRAAAVVSELQHDRQVFLQVSGLARLAGRAGNRVELAFVAGPTWQFVRNSSRQEVPRGVPADYRLEIVKFSRRGTIPYLTLGVETDVRVARRVSFVPELKLDWNPRFDDDDDVIVRPGVLVRLRF